MSRYISPPTKIELLTHQMCGEECRRLERVIKKEVLPKFVNVWFTEIPWDSEQWRYDNCDNAYCVNYLPSLVILRDNEKKIIDGANGLSASQIKDILRNEFGLEEQGILAGVNVDVVSDKKKFNWGVLALVVAALGMLAYLIFKKK